MNQDSEIGHLIELMPASGRMMTRIVSKPQNSKVIDFTIPPPWYRGTRSIYINFDLWKLLSRSERDLTLLRAISVLTEIKWLKFDLYSGIGLVALIGLVSQILQADATGIVVAGGLTAFAVERIGRDKKSLKSALAADEIAIKIASRRGYTEPKAAGHLLSSLETIAGIENRPLDFNELIRCQNLKKLANISFVGVPDSARESR